MFKEELIEPGIIEDMYKNNLNDKINLPKEGLKNMELLLLNRLTDIIQVQKVTKKEEEINQLKQHHATTIVIIDFRLIPIYL